MERTKSKSSTPIKAKSIEKIPVFTEEKELVQDIVISTPVVERPRLRYKKIGGGSLTFKKATYKTNDILEAYPEEIPNAFKDTLVCISSPELQKKAEDYLLNLPKITLYEVTSAGMDGWYNVINISSKKRFNEKSLKLADAESLCRSLNS